MEILQLFRYLIKSQISCVTYYYIIYKKIVHATFHTLGLLSITVALVAVFQSNNTFPYSPNLASLHTWVGLSAVVLFCLNFSIGLIFYASSFVPINMKIAFMPSHTFLGSTCFVFVCIAALTGISQTNTENKCGFTTNTKDNNPVLLDYLIPSGCLLANILGTLILALLFTVLFSMQKLVSNYEL